MIWNVRFSYSWWAAPIAIAVFPEQIQISCVTDLSTDTVASQEIKAFPRYLPGFLVRHTSPFGVLTWCAFEVHPSSFCQFILVRGLCEDVNSRSCVPLLPTPFISGNFRTPKEKKRVPPIFSFYREQCTPLPPIYMKSEGGWRVEAGTVACSIDGVFDSVLCLVRCLCLGMMNERDLQKKKK
ncbi:hypothetical protein CEXT_441611 [Caerostris extrusa]|uniref:Secreted protein n=1 Tax=Caerostris extrusa TaxID=172846 RepID=A0AAV4X6I5_CAEEX|nr:hypothetical protein CEXT_441611 [Caerostris extrusa]